VDANFNIINAEKLSGITVFSKLQPVENLIGINLEEILSMNESEKDNKFHLKKKQLKAFINAAKHFVNEEGQIVPEVKEIYGDSSISS
jgi:hypothetical protein